MSKKDSKKTKQPIGCAYLVVVTLITGLLLMINIVLVGAFMHVNSNLFLRFYNDLDVYFRITQAAQIVLPVILTMAQFWIFDRIVDRAFGYGRSQQLDDG